MASSGATRPRCDDLVDHAVGHGLFRRHDEVAVGVLGHLLLGLAGVLGQHAREQVAHAQDLLGLQLDVAGLALDTAPGLVQQDAGVRQREALALGPGRQQHRGGRGGLAEAEGGDVGLDELERVVDGEQRRDLAAGRVDVEVDVLVRLLGLEEEHLGADQVGHGVVDRRAEEDDALTQQPRVEVVGALAAVGRLDHGRDQIVVRLHRLPRTLHLHSLSSLLPRTFAALLEASTLRSSRDIGLPSSSTSSTWSSSHSSALPLRSSERTAPVRPAVSSWRRSSVGGGAHALGHGHDLGIELLVTERQLLGLDQGPQGQVGLDGGLGVHPHGAPAGRRASCRWPGSTRPGPASGPPAGAAGRGGAR